MSEPPDPHASFVIVDAIEGHVAHVALPDGRTEECPISRLPEGVRVGDVVRLERDEHPQQTPQ